MPEKIVNLISTRPCDDYKHKLAMLNYVYSQAFYYFDTWETSY
jgi:hypothetical protein